MIIPNIAASSQPVAYAGGLAPSEKPAFANALQATLAGLQATRTGTAALIGAPGHAQHGAVKAPHHADGPGHIDAG